MGNDRERSDITILIVDDEAKHAEATAEALARSGYRCLTAFGGQEGLELLEREPVDLVLTDLVMKELDGLEVLKRAKKIDPDMEVIVMTGYASVESAVEAMQQGAHTYLKKPLNVREVRAVVAKAVEKQQISRDNRSLQRQLDKRYGFEGLVGNSAAMQRIFDTMRQVAATEVTVLIEGESGTGKELVARALHQNSKRRHHRFVPLNCAALSEGILESELFGHEKGAFTGALRQRRGCFEFAGKGTLFLDEIGDMPLSIQVKLLRVLEQREVVRMGSNESIPVDVRIIVATNQDLDRMVKAEEFRQDLFFRLRVVTIEIPPLRQRQEDLPLLLDHFVQEFSERYNKTVTGITLEGRQALYRYAWPGNVRELRNCVESMVVTARRETLELSNIPNYIVQAEDGVSSLPALSGISLERAEQELIKNTLALVGGKREDAAKMLGISERTLYRKIKRYGLEEAKKETPDVPH